MQIQAHSLMPPKSHQKSVWYLFWVSLTPNKVFLFFLENGLVCLYQCVDIASSLNSAFCLTNSKAPDNKLAIKTAQSEFHFVSAISHGYFLLLPDKGSLSP